MVDVNLIREFLQNSEIRTDKPNDLSVARQLAASHFLSGRGTLKALRGKQKDRQKGGLCVFTI
jgi:hypothetical protein